MASGMHGKKFDSLIWVSPVPRNQSAVTQFNLALNRKADEL